MKDSQTATDTNPWRFFVLALGLSWLFWIPLALLGEDPMRFPYLILMILGGLGPAMAEIILVFGPLPEELGWSGYAIDGLQSKRSALGASLIIGLVWAVWHLPLFFMEGTFQSEQIGFATPAFWWYMLPTLPISVLDTWIYNNANRSTLSAILLHFMVNVSGELFGLSQHARFFQAGLIFVVTAAFVVIWGPTTLMRQPTDKATQIEDRLRVAA